MIFGLTKKTAVFYLVLIVVLAGSFVFFKRASGVGLLPFGGKVIVSFPCPCSDNYLLTISGPVGGQFMYYPFTQLYESYNLGPAAGMWALGFYSPGGVCLVPSTFGCNNVGAPIGTITPTVGSSPF